MKTRIVKDWMTANVISIPSSCTLPEAYWLMLNNNIRRIPVVDHNTLVGIVTLEDLRQVSPLNVAGFDIIHISDRLVKLPVRQLMTENPKTISPAACLSDAAQVMLRHEISALPVLDGNELVGLITARDILRAYVEIEEKH
jgi:acetoin utilization protein AcuB